VKVKIFHKQNKIYDDERKDNEIDCKLFSEINDFQNNLIFKSMYLYSRKENLLKEC
jgi:hypothetical protein